MSCSVRYSSVPVGDTALTHLSLHGGSAGVHKNCIHQDMATLSSPNEGAASLHAIFTKRHCVLPRCQGHLPLWPLRPPSPYPWRSTDGGKC